MAKEENLVPFSSTENRDRTVECAKKAGIASGEARRKKKLLRQELEILLDITDKNNKTIQEKICFALIKKASEGDTKAFEIIRDTLGQKPIDVIQKTEVPIIKDDI